MGPERGKGTNLGFHFIDLVRVLQRQMLPHKVLASEKLRAKRAPELVVFELHDVRSDKLIRVPLWRRGSRPPTRELRERGNTNE